MLHAYDPFFFVTGKMQKKTQAQNLQGKRITTRSYNLKHIVYLHGTEKWSDAQVQNRTDPHAQTYKPLFQICIIVTKKLAFQLINIPINC